MSGRTRHNRHSFLHRLRETLPFPVAVLVTLLSAVHQPGRALASKAPSPKKDPYQTAWFFLEVGPAFYPVMWDNKGIEKPDKRLYWSYRSFYLRLGTRVARFELAAQFTFVRFGRTVLDEEDPQQQTFINQTVTYYSLAAGVFFRSYASRRLALRHGGFLTYTLTGRRPIEPSANGDEEWPETWFGAVVSLVEISIRLVGCLSLEINPASFEIHTALFCCREDVVALRLSLSVGVRFEF